MQVANPNRAQFTKCASYAIPSTTQTNALHQLRGLEKLPLRICECYLSNNFRKMNANCVTTSQKGNSFWEGR